MKKFLWIIFPCILMFFLCAKAEKTAVQNDNHPWAPEFSLEDLNGDEITLSDYEGKIVFLNFWATWCGYCRYEIPGFLEVYAKYKDKGMEIIGISLDNSSSKVASFAEKYKITYPVVMGTRNIVRDYQPGFAIPVTIIIDQEGKIRHRHVGYMSKEILENYFLKLIEEK